MTYSQEVGKFMDSRDGKTYKTVQIGRQVWMAENLAYKTKLVCWTFGDRPENLKRYGYLYPWEAAKTACPDGWRLPSKSDFDSLFIIAKKTDIKIYEFLTRKENNGFSATFGGFREENGGFINKDYTGIYWSSTKGSQDTGWHLSIDKSSKNVDMQYIDYSSAYSVRCIRVD